MTTLFDDPVVRPSTAPSQRLRKQDLQRRHRMSPESAEQQRFVKQ